MKIYTLMENTALNPCFYAEHGLSLYIETAEHKILFDAGQSPAFIKNAQALDIDLTQVDTFVLSHGHYDHGGSLKNFLQLNNQAKIYLNKNAFGDYFSEDGRYIGLDMSLKNSSQLVFCEDNCIIDKNITISSCNDKIPISPIVNYGLNHIKNGQTLTDKFLHEQYLTIIENNKTVVFSGCSHKGILNIMHWLSPDILIGGFHFMKLNCENDTDAKTLAKTAAALNACQTDYYTCHCTGLSQYDYLKNLMGSKLHYLKSGSILEL